MSLKDTITSMPALVVQKAKELPTLKKRASRLSPHRP